jgi:hypothetical protein
MELGGGGLWGWEVDGTSSGACSVLGRDIASVDASGYITLTVVES